MSDKDWALYAQHRAHFTDALVASATREGGSLCVLGAGNCNDIDLERLAGTFAEIHLVDIDAQALARAVARQPAALRPRLFRHAPVDLSGLPARRLGKWKRMPPTIPEVETAAAGALKALLARLPGEFDVVASACVLTQMSFALLAALGDGHPALEAVRLALMGTHLNTLVGLTGEGGKFLFVCDMVSSNLYPLDALPPDRALREVMAEIVAAGACYFAANPEIVRRMLRQVGEPELLDPWLWTGPLGRTYFVYAYRVMPD
jgi:hypothetical protein